jgi:hypothetical protein
MAYATYSVSNVLALVQAVADYAQAQGWTVVRSGASNSVATITAPGHATSFVVSALSGTTIQTTQLWVYGQGQTGNLQARTAFHVVTTSKGSWGGPPVLAHFFTELGDNPWFAAAVDCGGGSYRNFCFGYLEKFGTYSDGAFVSGTQMPAAYYNGGFSSEDFIAYLLTGCGSYSNSGNRGSVLVNGAWTPFAVQGFNDDDLHLVGAPPYFCPLPAGWNAANAFSGYTPLLPINIYRGSLDRTNGFWQPLGYPPGIRQIDMTNFAPAQEFTLPDSSVWRVFPAMRKADMTPLPDVETSGPLGYAFRVSGG